MIMRLDRLQAEIPPPTDADSDGASIVQELLRERFEGIIEGATGREVIGCMSGNQQDPDLMCEVFILSPTDLL